ncbi:MAG: uroporphyrinogen decarboxylase family protein [Pirellulales bacterium]|nr:uroporphyrinogen decarboxylase family protein [Pirellulales bacterium]
MNQPQWEMLLAVIRGERVEPLPVGLIIDSPWLPNWAGISILDYFSSESMWLQANLRVVREFPDILFLPGFWSEFGMCTEPSAFGARCRWAENEFPFADPVISDPCQIASLEKPDPAVHGFLPLVLKRLEHCQAQIQEAGHAIRFAIARGPFNIASFLMGTTEFFMGLRTDPEAIHALLNRITDMLVDWLALQIKTIPTIGGVFLLDDQVGFIGKDDFRAFALPYLKRIYDSFDVDVKFFHNDARGLICAEYLLEMGVNLFNFSFEHGLEEIRELTGNRITLLGNIPPRDVLAGGTPDDVRRSVRKTLDSIQDTTRLILSCGGGVPPGVSTENIQALLDARF